MITSNRLDRLRAVTDDLNLVIEGHDSQLTLIGTIDHIVNL